MIDTRDSLTGLIAAPLAPMDSHGQLRLEVVREYARFLSQRGVKGVFLNGTSGEGVSLSCEERKALAREWVDASPEGFRVVVNVSHCNVRRSQELACSAVEAGADGVSTMASFFYRPTALGQLVEYCAAIATAVPDTPFYYYHIPEMAGVDFPMVYFLTLAQDAIPNLSGIKYTKEDRVDFEGARLAHGGRYNILSGCDNMLVSTYSTGCRGFIGSTYNYASPLFLEMMSLFDSGQVHAANELQVYLVRVIKLLARSGDYFAMAKRVMSELGVDCGSVRLPLSAVPESRLDEVMVELDSFGFFKKISELTE